MYSKDDLELHLSSHNVPRVCAESDHEYNSCDDMYKHMITHKGENIQTDKKVKDNQFDSVPML